MTNIESTPSFQDAQEAWDTYELLGTQIAFFCYDPKQLEELGQAAAVAKQQYLEKWKMLLCSSTLPEALESADDSRG